MVFLAWTRPSAQDQETCIKRSGDFNYEAKHRGISGKPVSGLDGSKGPWKDGFFVNHKRVLVGSGLDTYEKGKTALQAWRHFGLDWAFVDHKTPIKTGSKFCVCVKQLLPWLVMPLEVVYVDDKKKTRNTMPSFSFAGGTLRGHLLAGEERFSIEVDDKKQVWYEVLSFSKPAHILSFVGYPYVLLQQKYFAHQSANELQSYLTSHKS